MKGLVLVAGVAGMALVCFSLPPLRGPRLRRRVDPFLDGLAGRPSGLLVRPSVVEAKWVARALASAGLLGRSDVRQRLEACTGHADEVAFRLEQFAWAGVAFLTVMAGSVSTGLIGGSVMSPTLALAGVVAGVTAFLARDWYLTKQIEQRSRRLRDQLPSAIDLMTLALMAGESVPGAIDRVAERASGVIGEEFHRVGGEIRSGSTVIDALDAFRTRVADPAIGRFVDALCTAVERGTSLAEVLRSQADDVRAGRRRELIELGGRREIWMLIPVVFLIMPVVVVFALYPGLVSLDLLVP